MVKNILSYFLVFPIFIFYIRCDISIVNLYYDILIFYRNEIDKICCRDFWKGRDSYRGLQNAFHKYITSKGFDLERGLPVEETGAKHEKIEDLKKLTNFENTKKVLDNMKLELPETPDINNIKLIKLNREKVENEIIKPKDDMIEKLSATLELMEISIHKQSLYDIENNKRTVKDYELFDIAYVLGIDVNDLLKDIKNKF